MKFMLLFWKRLRRGDYSFIRTAFTWPSWLGLFVILALPRDVWIIAPFISLFCLAKKRF